MYVVVVLVNGEFEKGENPHFLFENNKKMSEFLNLCFENGYQVEVSRKEANKEE